MGKPIKKKNTRKSESDLRRQGRGSSSGSNSTESGLSRVDVSEHEILIDKQLLKQVRVVNLKTRELEEIDDDDDGSPEVDEKQKHPSKSLELELAEVLDRSDRNRSKAVPKELEEEEVEDVKLHNSKNKKREPAHGNSSTPPPLRKERSHSPEEHHDHHDQEPDPELHHPRYLNQAYWDPKPSSSVSHYYYQKKRIPSPFLPPPGTKLSAHSRLRMNLLNPIHNPPRRRSGGTKEGNTAQRVASAKRMTIMDLKSKIKQLQDEIEKLKKENRFLNHLHHRQDNALKKWEGKDAELPRLLNQHKDELRTLQQQLRRAQQQTREGNEKLSMRDKKIFRLEAELDKLRSLVHEEHLQDRHQLQEELDITRMNLTGAEKRIREYMKHVDILEKNHRHQLATQERKLMKVNNGTFEMQQLVANLRLALRNKDRMLNYIQMRSTGRNLIKAFHAEKSGIEDMLYGTSVIDPSVARGFQPPEQLQMLKAQKPELIPTSKSENFGGGYAVTIPDFEAVAQFASTRLAIESNIQRNCNEIVDFKNKQKVREKEELPKRPLSKHSRSLDSMIKASTMSPRSMKDDKKLESDLPNGTAGSSTVGEHRMEMKKPNVKHDSQQKSKMKNQTKEVNQGRDRKAGMNPPQQESSKEDLSLKPPKGPAPKRKGVPSNKQKAKPIAKSLRNSKPEKNKNYNQTVKANQGKVKCNKSKELVYHATDSGFKYEGPFVQKNKGKLAKEEESAEVLYTAQSEKISEHSSASSTSTSCSYSDQSASSSRSEMISNIDILSARIRESCVLVPPPEANLKSPRNAINSSYVIKDSVSSDLYYDVEGSNASKPQVGPSGDGSMHSQTLNSFMHQGQGSPMMTMSSPDNFQSMQSSPYQGSAGVLQFITSDGGQQPTSPRTNQTFLCTSSQGDQMQAISMPVNHYIQVNDSSGNPQLTHIGQSNQSSQPNMLSFSSPGMQSQNYTSYNNVNFLTEPQPNYPDGQQLQSQLSRYPNPNELAYYPYGPPTMDIQQPTHSTHQNALYGPAPPASTQKSATLPPVSYFNPVGNSGGGESSLPSINNNSSANQAIYNPSYYVNLGSWK